MHTVVRAALIAAIVAGCRPSDVLTVPPPTGVVGSTTLANQTGAENAFAGAKGQLFDAIAGHDGLVQVSGLLTDEFAWTYIVYFGSEANVDARYTAATGVASAYQESTDPVLQSLLTARSSLLLALNGLKQFEPASGQARVGEAFALVGYAELLMAESYCAGIPLSVAMPGGGIQYGTPLTRDSLLGTAEAHFDSAVARGAGNDTVLALARVGLGRTRLQRAHFAEAAAAVANVPTGFVYNTVSATDQSVGLLNLWSNQLPPNDGCGAFNVSDREGGNGLNFVSGGDPRLVVDSTIQQTCDGRIAHAVPGTWYYPVRFGRPSAHVALASGVEARLIAAEAALQAGAAATWAADLNALRAAAPQTYLGVADSMPALTTDSTTTASAATRVDVMFRERAFWLFGTATRLGDLRRLVRQYGRDQSTVFPSGPYANGHNPNLPTPLPTYGTDVSFTLPTPKSGYTTSNPYVKGCLAPPSTA